MVKYHLYKLVLDIHDSCRGVLLQVKIINVGQAVLKCPCPSVDGFLSIKFVDLGLILLMASSNKSLCKYR